MNRGNPRILPPSIRDARGKAFAEVLAGALDEPDFRTLLFERIDSVGAAALPALIREFSIEEFVEPGMSEAVVRRLLKEAFILHRMKSTITGVRRGLKMLGMRIAWKQWFQMTPPGEPGTHRITVFVNEQIFDGETDLLSARNQRSALRMIIGMKRASQTEEFRVGIGVGATLGLAGIVQAAQAVDVRARTVAATNVSRRLGLAGVVQATSAVKARASTVAATNVARGLGLFGALSAAQLCTCRMRTR